MKRIHAQQCRKSLLTPQILSVSLWSWWDLQFLKTQKTCILKWTSGA